MSDGFLIYYFKFCSLAPDNVLGLKERNSKGFPAENSAGAFLY